MRESDATRGWDLLIDLVFSDKDAKTTGVHEFGCNWGEI
jgi:hypothetical protein